MSAITEISVLAILCYVTPLNQGNVVDRCVMPHCQHGGTCVNHPDSYTCNCLVGFTGKNCQIDIDDCSNTPCRHGGICKDEVNGFECICLPGYTGTLCEKAPLKRLKRDDETTGEESSRDEDNMKQHYGWGIEGIRLGERKKPYYYTHEH